MQPVWPEGAAGQGVLRMELDYRWQFKFGERIILGGAPRGGAGETRAAAAPPPALITAFPLSLLGSRAVPRRT